MVTIICSATNLKIAGAKLGLWVSALPRLTAKPGAFVEQFQFSVEEKLLSTHYPSIQAHAPSTAPYHVTQSVIGALTHVRPICSTLWNASHFKLTLSGFFQASRNLQT
jgi:hypothetical protein